VQVPKNLLVGFNMPAEVWLSLAACACAAIALVQLLFRAPSERRRAVVVPATVAVSAVAIASMLAPAGLDLLTTRSFIVVLVPIVIVLAAGFATGHAGAAALVAMALVSAVPIVAGATESRYARADVRGAVAAAGRLARTRAIVLSPALDAEALSYYLPGAKPFPRRARVAEVVVLALATEGRFTGGAPHPPDPRRAKPLRGFELTERRLMGSYALARFRSPRAIPVRLTALRGQGLVGGAAVILQRATPAQGRSETARRTAVGPASDSSCARRRRNERDRICWTLASVRPHSSAISGPLRSAP
jgi:hypothetical protein